MNEIIVKAPAKINLTLDITGRLENGYHTLESVFQSVSLYDELTVSLCGQEINVECDNGIAGGRDNICYKAAEVMARAADYSGGIFVGIRKNIPSEAGLGGGSSDAAAVMLALNELLGLDLSVDTLRAAAKPLGADVPFFIGAGAAHVTGIGDIISPAPALRNVHIVLAKPACGVSTPLAYRRLDEASSCSHGNIAAVLSGLERGDITAAASGCVNSFEDVIGLPEVFEIKSALLSAGAELALMSGSGSAVFGIFTDIENAERALEALRSCPFAGIYAPV